MEDETQMEDQAGSAEGAADTEPPEGERQLVETLQKRIRADKAHHADAFKRMRKDMDIARLGADKDWIEAGNYVANITGRHINQKVAALYAKNPKAIARRRERLDFELWDESSDSLMEAMQVAMEAQTAAQQASMAGDMMGAQMMMSSPMVMQSVALVQDYQQGMQERQQMERVGKTLEILFAYFTQEQTPVDFKTSMKQLVRRATTTGVGYIKLAFQREYGRDPETADRLADFTQQLQHVERLMNEAQSDEYDSEAEGQREELQRSIASLQEQQYVLMREGLVFDFPESTRVIPDSMTSTLTGFVGARHLTVEYLYTPDEVKETFGVDVKAGKYARHSINGGRQDPEQIEMAFDEDGEKAGKDGLVCVWEHYDRPSGNVYYLADGHPSYLRDPAAPPFYVEQFWPVYALTFNEVEHTDHLFPPSDVKLIEDMQRDYNRARQGQREHRQAARPRFVSRTGLMSDEGKMRLSAAEPFSVTELDFDGDDIRRVLQTVDVPGVDPNLYETGQTMTDIQLTIGAQEAQFGAVAKATATESAIADDSRMASVDSNVDDLDSFLTRVARSAGQILLQEMSEEKVKEIAGRGAIWPQMTLEQVAKEVFLEIEAGSSGKPNQAAEVKKWREMLPFLIQMPKLDPEWLVRESLRRLDDKMDLTDAIADGMPSIVQLNQMSQPSPEDPANAPDQQGGEGGDQTPRGPEQTEGTDAPMGNNRV